MLCNLTQVDDTAKFGSAIGSKQSDNWDQPPSLTLDCRAMAGSGSKIEVRLIKLRMRNVHIHLDRTIKCRVLLVNLREFFLSTFSLGSRSLLLVESEQNRNKYRVWPSMGFNVDTCVTSDTRSQARRIIEGGGRKRGREREERE